jgi:hypothetical protein
MLAANDNDFGKVVIGLIFAVIWALSAAASAYSKKKQAEKQRKIREQAEAAARNAPNWGDIAAQNAPVPPIDRPSPYPQRTSPQRPARVPMPSRQPAQVPPGRTQKKPKIRKPKPVPVAPAVAEVAAALQSVEPQIVTRPPDDAYTRNQRDALGKFQKREGFVDAAALRAWLRPATLRHQFVLTEVLQKPLGLRRPDQH